jgi:hypothetical protein
VNFSPFRETATQPAEKIEYPAKKELPDHCEIKCPVGQFAFTGGPNHDGITASWQESAGFRMELTAGLLLADSPVDVAYLA